MGTEPMPPPWQSRPVQQLFKVNRGRFSNPKRLLKPLLICLPFCFVCSVQVKGNLTFGILTANNPAPRTGPGGLQCQHVAHKDSGDTPDMPAMCRGSRKAHVASGPVATWAGAGGGPPERSATPRAGPYLTHRLPPHPALGVAEERGCWEALSAETTLDE